MAPASANSVLQMGQQLLSAAIQEVDRLKGLQDLDPVPAPAELLQTYRSARTQLLAAHAALASSGRLDAAAGGSNISSTWTTEVAALPDSAQQLGVLIGVLEAGSNCQQPLQQALLPEQLVAAWQAAMALAAPGLQQQQSAVTEGGSEVPREPPSVQLAMDHLQARAVLSWWLLMLAGDPSAITPNTALPLQVCLLAMHTCIPANQHCQTVADRNWLPVNLTLCLLLLICLPFRRCWCWHTSTRRWRILQRCWPPPSSSALQQGPAP